MAATQIVCCLCGEAARGGEATRPGEPTGLRRRLFRARQLQSARLPEAGTLPPALRAPWVHTTGPVGTGDLRATPRTDARFGATPKCDHSGSTSSITGSIGAQLLSSLFGGVGKPEAATTLLAKFKGTPGWSSTLVTYRLRSPPAAAAAPQPSRAAAAAAAAILVGVRRRESISALGAREFSSAQAQTS